MNSISRKLYETKISGYSTIIKEGSPVVEHVEDVFVYSKKPLSKEEVEKEGLKNGINLVSGFVCNLFLFSVDIETFCKSAVNKKLVEEDEQ